jgi:hypothetical protein
MKKQILFVLLVLILLLPACLPAGEQPSEGVEEIVQATFQALTEQAPVPLVIPTLTPMPLAAAPTQGGTDNIPTFTPVGGLSGSIAGQLSYPSEFIPSMAIVAYVAGGSPLDYYYVITTEGSSTYQLDNLPPGNYYVVAYVGAGLAGGYSQAVPCGLSAECGDHSLISVPVAAGQVTNGINPGDWYAPPEAFLAYPLP